MNDSPKAKITLEEIRKMTVEEVMKLEMETLQELHELADKAVFGAGLTLDWIRGIIDRKKAQQAPDDKAGA